MTFKGSLSVEIAGTGKAAAGACDESPLRIDPIAHNRASVVARHRELR